jgi:hypothetical protein
MRAVFASPSFSNQTDHLSLRSRLRGHMAALAAAGFLLSPLPAQAIDFTYNGISGNFDSTYTVGGAIRTSGRDPRMIGVVNGGTNFSINGDNGDLNFDKGDLTSLAVRGINELRLSADNFEFFGRVNYFYDYVNNDKTLARTQLQPEARDRAGLRIDLLDLYVSGKFQAGSVPFSVRIGNQVLSWGESTFIQNGINVINPADVTKLRAAGSELREGLLPVPIIQFSASLTQNFSIEAFYQMGWKRTEIEAEGTFFSTNDFASPGGRFVYLGFGLPNGPRDNPSTNAGLPVGSIVARDVDRDAKDSGQFGVALRYLAQSLNDTEIGAYFVRYNSRTPLISAHTGTLAGLLGGNYAATSNYYREYPNGIKLLGGSLSTVLGDSGIALQGEYAYHWDQPIQVDDVELLFAALSPLDPFLGFPAAIQPVFRRNQLGAQGFNQDIPGYRRKAYSTAQFTVSDVFSQVGPFDQMVVLGEVGMMWVHGMEGKAMLRYDSPNTVTNANPFYTTIARQPATEDARGYADAYSAGYRLLVRGEWNNAIGAVTLLPSIAFNHDVQGTSPTPISNFVEGRKSVSLGVGANYLNRWQANIGYTTNFGGGKYNLLRDRDFMSLSVSYSF